MGLRLDPVRSRRLPSRPVCLPFLLTLVLLVSIGCGGGAGGQDGEHSDSSSTEEAENGSGKKSADSTKASREKTTSVDAADAASGTLVIPVVAEGRIRTRRSAEIRAEIAGRIDRVSVAEGSRVRKGQLLIQFDGREYGVGIAEARSRYLEALSRLMIEEEGGGSPVPEDGIESQLLDLWNQERDGKISRQERLERERLLEMEALRQGAYRHDLVEARTGLATARADEERGRLNLEKTEIRAPFDGVVEDLDADIGERVTVGQVFCTLVDNLDIEAEIGVLESDLRGLEVDRPVLLAVPALGETLHVKVDVISPTIDPESRTCRVLMRFRNDDGRIRPGMFVRASIAGQSFEDRLLVPRAAILTRDGRPLLFRVEGDRAKWVYVELGLQNDYVVEIARVLQGGPLNAGTPVVISNHLTLSDNAKVKIKKLRGLGDPWAQSSREK